MSSFLDTVRRAIDDYHMLCDGDSVIVGLSGGADSVALFNSLLELKSELNLKLYAAHINHNLRGAEADRDERFVASLCESRGVELFIKSVDVKALAESKKIGTELCGREVRYEFFSELSEKLNAKVATAHTASDNAETVIFNLARGAGLNGMSGIKPVRGNIIRPLIYAARADIEAYCEENGLAFVNDSTNFTDDYTRNKIRHILIPAFRELNPDFEWIISRETVLFSKLNSYLELKSDDAIASCQAENGYDCLKLKELPDGLRYEVIYRLCTLNAAEPDYKLVGLLDKAIVNGGAVNFKNGVRAVCKQSLLRFVKDDDIEDFSDLELKHGLTFIYNNKQYSVEKLKYTDLNIVFRTRREGDRFTLPRRRVTKSLKKLFNELKIPDENRSRLLMVAEGSNILWIETVGYAESAADWFEINIKELNQHKERGIIMHKDIEKVLYDEREISSIVNRLAAEIDEDYNDKDWLMVGVLKGSILFMADLMKAMKNDFKIDFVVVSSYADGTESTGRVNVLKDISQSIVDMDILIVEDIIDSGNTLHFLVQYFMAKGAKSVKIVTLFDKPDRRRIDVPVEYVGKVIPDAFIVGYGLDYAEKYRTLPYVGILKPEVYS